MADWDEVEGKAKQVGGDVTGDEDMKAEGVDQEDWGDAKEKAGDAWGDVKEKADDVRDRL